MALFHFVRQQAGWVGVYRARAGQRGSFDRLVDDGAVYAATLYPLLYWHAHLGESRFSWFVPGDFVDLARMLSPVLPAARALWVVLLAVFFVRQAALFAKNGVLLPRKDRRRFEHRAASGTGESLPPTATSSSP